MHCSTIVRNKFPPELHFVSYKTVTKYFCVHRRIEMFPFFPNKTAKNALQSNKVKNFLLN